MSATLVFSRRRREVLHGGGGGGGGEQHRPRRSSPMCRRKPTMALYAQHHYYSPNHMSRPARGSAWVCAGGERKGGVGLGMTARCTLEENIFICSPSLKRACSGRALRVRRSRGACLSVCVSRTPTIATESLRVERTAVWGCGGRGGWLGSSGRPSDLKLAAVSPRFCVLSEAGRSRTVAAASGQSSRSFNEVVRSPGAFSLELVDAT